MRTREAILACDFTNGETHRAVIERCQKRRSVHLARCRSVIDSRELKTTERRLIMLHELTQARGLTETIKAHLAALKGGPDGETTA